MNALKVKNYLWKNGLTISEMARRLDGKYDATFDSLRTMLTDLLYDRKYNEKLADLVEAEFGLVIPKPDKPQTVREAVRRAA